MTDDLRLMALLQSAVRPISTASTTRDLWPLVIRRSRGRLNWTWLDVGLTAVLVMAFLMRPDLLEMLAYHF